MHVNELAKQGYRTLKGVAAEQAKNSLIWVNECLNTGRLASPVLPFRFPLFALVFPASLDRAVFPDLTDLSGYHWTVRAAYSSKPKRNPLASEPMLWLHWPLGGAAAYRSLFADFLFQSGCPTDRRKPFLVSDLYPISFPPKPKQPKGVSRIWSSSLSLSVNFILLGFFSFWAHCLNFA